MKTYIHILLLFLSAALLVGCMQELDDFVYGEQTEVVKFRVKESATKAELVNDLTGSAGVYGYKNNESLGNDFSNLEYKFDGDELYCETKNTSIYWKNISTSKSDTIDFYAYAPYEPYEESSFTITKTQVSETDPETNATKVSYTYSFDYTMPSDKSAQKDIIVAHASVEGDNRQNIPLVFNHVFTAVRFEVAKDISNVVSIEVQGVKDKGTYTFGKGWSAQTTSTTGGSFIYVDDKEALDEKTAPLMMIPQSFPSNSDAQVVLTYKESLGATETKNITLSLDGQIWEPGRLITYTIHKQTQSSQSDTYIYFDLAAGNVTINANTANGYVYVKGMTEPQPVSVKHAATNKYYVYQSNPENSTYFGGYNSVSDFNDNKNCKIPNYPGVTYKGQPWADFITNNSNVEQVIEVWDDGKNVRGESFNYVHEGYKDVARVRDAGRTHTPYHISVSGSLICDLTIDNIYSAYQVKAPYRETGGLTFVPNHNEVAELRLYFIGDNRFGNIHFADNDDYTDAPSDKYRFIFEGSGTLTVADVDFYYQDGGYFSNRHASVIGGDDAHEETKGIIINSGTIYAGSTKAENCSCIGGGGNGDGRVIINGGIITAVATTTGTAIGGGIGYSYAGGKGDVMINGGNVYAYNHANDDGIPSSAIGGAGSRDSNGNDGNVTITGGNIYAYSELGTAIGGGSSSTKVGGNANVTISGGYIVAKTGNPISNGIGGGTGGTDDGTGGKPASNGGSAKITISGTPIIRTGSVGGGMKNNTKGTIGSADIDISGNPDIQAQFVMAKGAGVPPEFTMSGGRIRNSATNDGEYLHVKTQGGAVYMEDGILTMSGGSITNCSAEEGGAIYVNGGDVTIEGDAEISGNLARGGNGGAICIKNGNFIMQGTASIKGNAAQYNNRGGNGGGVYVSSSNDVLVQLLSGSITGNSADRRGGGVAVDMGSASGKTADIVIGTENGSKSTLTITSNTTLVSGGGLYAEGLGAKLTIYSGTIFENKTFGYTYNPDIANEGGMVTLFGDGDTLDSNGSVIEGQVKLNYVEVTYDPNQGKINGSTEPYVQKVVTSTNSLLLPPESVTKTGYTFMGWNTRKDGLGQDKSSGDIINLSENLYLYAKWQIQQ